MQTNSLVKKAVEICGSQTALAVKCNVRQQHVWKWLRMKKVPAERAIAIEHATDGRVTRAELRPDLFGPEANFNKQPINISNEGVG